MWRHNKSHKGGRKKAEPSTWMLKRRHGRRMQAGWPSPSSSKHAIGGTEEAQGRQKRRPHWGTELCSRTHMLRVAIIGRPLCIHSATTAMQLRPLCLIRATVERPLASIAVVERHVYHLWTTKATMMPPLSVQRRPGQFYGRTREAQRSQALCKGGIKQLLFGIPTALL